MYETDTTELLLRSRRGDPEAGRELWTHVYEELRELARRRLLGYRTGDTLNTTALVHEAYIRLFDGSRVEWNDRAHFLALAARAMRFVIVDHVRTWAAEKRGGEQTAVTLDEQIIMGDPQVAERAADVISLHEALNKLSEIDDRLSLLVEYRFFGGLTYEEIAEVTQQSLSTVKRDWRRARTWLYRVMQEDSASSPPDHSKDA